MNPITTQGQGIDMETLTLDVQGVPDEKVRFLQQLATLWKEQAEKKAGRSEEIVFATHRSDLIGGEFKRANAYE